MQPKYKMQEQETFAPASNDAHYGLGYKIAGGASVLAISTMASATGTDFSAITGAVDVSTLITGLVALGVFMIGPGVAKWATKKLSKFFG